MATTSRKPFEILEAPLTFSEFYDAVFSSTELAAYVVRVGDSGDFTFEDANEVVERISGLPLSEIRGKPLAASMPPDVAECLYNNLRRCVETGQPVSYHRTCEVAGQMLSFKTNLTPVIRHSGEAKFIVGLTRDVTQETNLIASAQHHSALLRSLGIALPSAVYLLDMEQKSLKFIGGEASEAQREWRNAIAEVAGEGPARFFHPDEWPRVQEHWEELANLKDGEVCTISYHLAAFNGEYRRHIHRETVFSRDAAGEVKFVLGVSEDVSEHDRIEQEVRDLSARMLTLQIDERRRIAQELHDSTGQHLTAAALALSNARTIERGHEGTSEASLQAVIEDAALCLGEAQREIRVLSYLLHPPHLQSEGLAEAIETFAIGFGRRAGLKMKVDVSHTASLIDDDTAMHLFRVCQEALTNVYRHAKARKVQVLLEVNDAIRLTVKDDGIGFDDTAADRILGVGLPGMRERMSRLGGAVHISGNPGGTTLVATIPLGVPAPVRSSGAHLAA